VCLHSNARFAARQASAEHPLAVDDALRVRVANVHGVHDEHGTEQRVQDLEEQLLHPEGLAHGDHGADVGLLVHVQRREAVLGQPLQVAAPEADEASVVPAGGLEG
jgi:hypothetical protein